MTPRGRRLYSTIHLTVAVALLSSVLTGCGPEDGHATGGEILEKTPTKTGEAGLHPVHILQPEQPKVLTGKTLPDGTPETLACGTCHATKEPNFKTASGGDLKDFHQGLKIAHGTLSCLSCHNPDNYDQLHLADERAVSFPDTMTLCAQCHGPQHRDYQRGSHGGMTGHWDLTKGPRTRNHCITCHDPHAPAYPLMMPVFKPLDTQSLPADARNNSH